MDKKNDKDKKKKDGEKEETKWFTIKNATDLQRVRLEKLMKNPTKEVIIPDRPKSKDHGDSAPTFVRNVMGSSAGAGSGEFHVYRHLRRKEFARLKDIEQKSLTEKLDDDFQQKLDNNKRMADEKTAKKRAKRLKKKAQQKKKPKQDSSAGKQDSDGESESEDKSDKDEEEEDTDKVLVSVDKEDPVAVAKDNNSKDQS